MDIEEEKTTETIVVEPAEDPVPTKEPVEVPAPTEEPEAEPIPSGRG